MIKPQNDTPKTNAFLLCEHVAHDSMWADFARELERTCYMLVNNRDTANEIVIACMEAAGIDRRDSFEADHLPALIQQIREERDRLQANIASQPTAPHGSSKREAS